MEYDKHPQWNNLAGKLTGATSGLIRWCTPSLLPGPQIDPWHDDLSVSYAPAGSMLEHSGWFADSERRIAQLHGSNRAFLVPAGSTTSNLVVARALARRGKPGVVLVDRQAHHSMIRGLTAFNVPWRFIDTGRWDHTFECPKPVKPADLRSSIHQIGGEVAAVCLLSTTYAGEVADFAGIRAVVDRMAPDAVLVADGAWESHFPFHCDLAQHRAARFAHLVSHSSHKAAGALQPGAVLLWNEGPMSFPVLDEAYRDLMSTSASFIITASIDSAYGQLAAKGDELIGRSIGLASRLSDGLRSGIPGVALFSDVLAASEAVLDPTKVTMALPPGPVTGYQVRDALIDRQVVVEKATPATVTFLATYGLDVDQVEATVAATCASVERLSHKGGPARRTVPDPFRGAPASPRLAPWEAQRAATDAAVVVPIDQAVGRVAVEQVEAYPPGVAVISEGFEVTADSVAWLRAVLDAGGSIVGRDPTLATLSVLAEAN